MVSLSIWHFFLILSFCLYLFSICNFIFPSVCIFFFLCVCPLFYLCLLVYYSLSYFLYLSVFLLINEVNFHFISEIIILIVLKVITITNDVCGSSKFFLCYSQKKCETCPQVPSFHTSNTVSCSFKTYCVACTNSCSLSINIFKGWSSDFSTVYLL